MKNLNKNSDKKLQGKRDFTQPSSKKASASEKGYEDEETLQNEFDSESVASNVKVDIHPKQTFDEQVLVEEDIKVLVDDAASAIGTGIEQLGFDSIETIAPVKSKPLHRTLLFKMLALSLMVLVLVETGLGLQQAWIMSPWLFGLYSTVVSLTSLLAIKTTFIEWRKLKHLKGVETQQAIAARLSESMQMGEADKFINSLLHNRDSCLGVQTYIANQREDHNDREKLILFEELVLSNQDEQAKKLVSRFAAESALLLAASPLAVVDMAVILWRNQRMITQIAAVYGIELGYWSRIRLVKGIIANILYAGTTEVITDLGTQLFSVEMSGKLSARLAQGLGGGLLTARLGYQAMSLCRPIAFSTESKPKLAKIHQQLLSELKSFSVDTFSKSRNKNLTTRD